MFSYATFAYDCWDIGSGVLSGGFEVIEAL